MQSLKLFKFHNNKKNLIRNFSSTPKFKKSKKIEITKIKYANKDEKGSGYNVFSDGNFFWIQSKYVPWSGNPKYVTEKCIFEGLKRQKIDQERLAKLPESLQIFLNLTQNDISKLPESFFSSLNSDLQLNLKKNDGSHQFYSGFSEFSKAKNLAKELVYRNRFHDYIIQSLIPPFYITGCQDEANKYSNPNSVVLKLILTSLNGIVPNEYGASEYRDVNLTNLELIGVLPSKNTRHNPSVYRGNNYD